LKTRGNGPNQPKGAFMSREVRDVFQSVVNFARDRYEDEIEKGYEFFWEEDYPEDFLLGTALDIAFINFEDWLLCDYSPEGGERLVDRYRRENETTGDEEAVLGAMKESVISLYEVVPADGGTALRDLLLGGEIPSGDGATRDLAPGDVFAARFLDIDGQKVMSPCVYPYSQGVRGNVLEYVDKQFGRYLKNKNPQGTMRQFLKEESYLFNAIWITSIFKLK
jgi:hypothetical protein